jgi:glycosyltransferase involved in cell wall biosynthesis
MLEAAAPGAMAKKKVLYVLHNHPSIRPGGSESYALELYEAMKETEWEPQLVARIGPDVALQRSARPGTPFSALDSDPNQYFFFTEERGFDYFMMTAFEKSLYTVFFADFLRATKPDVVHFHHTFFMGMDLVTITRRVLPEVPIVYTLHEYLPICHRQGQLLRTSGELCLEASPRRCHECFPDISEQYFFLRERFAKGHFAQVDLFLAPSRFLLERYVDWGIPPDRIRFEDYGRRPQLRVEAEDREGPRNRFAYFGQASPYKGLQVLLNAMPLVRDDHPDVRLRLHSANLEIQLESWREEFPALLEAAGNMVTFEGAYDHDLLPRLMAETDWVIVPSLWWENSPLVIQEALMHGRPVICSDVGGMAEKVENEVSGLHFRRGDPVSLAATIGRAASTPGLWERLRAGIPPVYGMDEHLASLTTTYDELLDRARETVLIG